MGRRTLPAAPAGSGVPRGARTESLQVRHEWHEAGTVFLNASPPYDLWPACRRHLLPTATTRFRACWSSPAVPHPQAGAAGAARRARVGSGAPDRDRCRRRRRAARDPPGPARGRSAPTPTRALVAAAARRVATDPGVAAVAAAAVRRQPGCRRRQSARAPGAPSWLASRRPCWRTARDRLGSDGPYLMARSHRRSGTGRHAPTAGRPRRADRPLGVSGGRARRPRRLRGRQRSLLGQPFRARADFRRGRYAWCTIEEQAEEALRRCSGLGAGTEGVRSGADRRGRRRQRLDAARGAP